MSGSALATLLFAGFFVIMHLFMHRGHGSHAGHGDHGGHGGGCCGMHGGMDDEEEVDDAAHTHGPQNGSGAASDTERAHAGRGSCH